MPLGDPAGYLPNVKRKRSKAKRNFQPIMSSKRVAAKTGGALAPSSHGRTKSVLRRKINEVRKARKAL
jgi:hypothetical protein